MEKEIDRQQGLNCSRLQHGPWLYGKFIIETLYNFKKITEYSWV